MNKYILLFLISLSFLKCKNEESIETKLKYESFSSEGETKTDSYKFCSITYVEIEYTYRVGNWVFKSSDGYKFAEGEYEN